MARAHYSCPRCHREWEAATPASVRFATGGPMYCHCGEISVLEGIEQVQITNLSKKTAADIVDHEAEWAEDPYHQRILMGAKALLGMPDWVYHTQWLSGATLWHNTNGKTSAKVSWDDQKGWVVDYL